MKAEPQQDAIAPLVEAARGAVQLAHAPYSGYPVGAALRTAGGRIITGCNVENASSGLTLCAERVAMAKAVSEGEREFVALAVVTRDGGTPCGACRQALAEFCDGDLQIALATGHGAARFLTLAELLPQPFKLARP